MAKKLGLFIDATSVNWSLIDQEKKALIDMGVYVFPAGCENFGSGRREQSKRTSRRLLRLRRIRYARIRARKFYLLREMAKHNMCPISPKELSHWKQHKEFPSATLSSWLAMNPYALRAKGLTEKLSLEELGRIFYQISRHRGYRFGERNSKLADSILSKGVPSEGKVGYYQTRRQLRGQTLGTYLNSIYPPNNTPYKRNRERIRNRICTVDMYFKEVHKLWAFQANFHYQLTDVLREQFIGHPEDIDPGGVLFFQRPLKSQKHRVGNCAFETNKTRCCASSLPYQELEAWKWANSIRYNSNPLKIDDARVVVRFFLSHYRFNFKEVKELLNLSDSTNFNYKDEEQFKGSFINAELSREKYFGRAWFSMEEKKKEDIFHALYFFDSSQRLEECAREKFGLHPRAAQQFSRISIDKSYALLSRKAVKKILYFLRKGYQYKTAVYLAGIRNALHKSWSQLTLEQEKEVIQVTINMHRDIPQHDLLFQLKQFFENTLQFDEFNIQRLYGFSKLNSMKKKRKLLPVSKEVDKQINQLKNATLVQSVFELRKVLNALIHHYGPIDVIACELSADLKVNRMQRYLYRVDQRRVAANNALFLEELKQLEVDLIPMNLLKYELWEECKQTCPFSGNQIPLEMLFTDYVQIVYIHPWSRALNDKSYNKTLCFSALAAKLNNRTPFEYFAEEDPEAWETVKTRAAKLFANTQRFPTSYKKFKRFVKKYNHRDVLKKQFNDGHQLSRSVGELLGMVAQEVNMIPGNITQRLVDEFLLMNIFPNQKCDQDFRRNALKAYVNAQCTKQHVQVLAKRDKYQRNANKTIIRPNHPNYLQQLEDKMHGVLVKHKKQVQVVSKRTLWTQTEEGKQKATAISIRGLLHKDSLFGKRTPPDAKTAMHMRRSLRNIKTLSQVEKIVDPVIRAMVKKQLIRSGEEGKIISPYALMGENAKGYPRSKIKLPNKNGDNVPVMRVRMRESFSNPIRLKEAQNRFAIPRNNHHIMIYVDESGEYKEEVVSFWEVVQRYSKGESIYRQLKAGEGELVNFLHINDMFLLGMDDLEDNLSYYPESVLRKHLYRIQKLSTKYYEFRLANKYVTPSMEAPEYIRINNFGDRKTGWKTYNPVKVEIDLIGKIHLMNN